MAVNGNPDFLGPRSSNPKGSLFDSKGKQYSALDTSKGVSPKSTRLPPAPNFRRTVRSRLDSPDLRKNSNNAEPASTESTSGLDCSGYCSTKSIICDRLSNAIKCRAFTSTDSTRTSFKPASNSSALA